VENYIKEKWAPLVRMLSDPQTSREDLEALEIERERQRDLLEGYKTVERIVDQRDAPANANVDHDHSAYISLTATMLIIMTFITVEYLCKWKGLVYADATWEDHDTISAMAQEQIDAFIARKSTPFVPYKSLSYGKQRPAFQKIDEDPDYIKVTGGELKDFQVTGLNWLAYLWCRNMNGILADEVSN
jgi:chromodomain-helicase-DNA-binding protein 1